MVRIYLYLVSLVLTGCAGLPPQSDAIHHALVTDLALRQAVEICVAGDTNGKTDTSRAANDAKAERARWWDRNGTLVLAADYGLLQLNWQGAAEQVEPQRAVLAMVVLEQVQWDAQAQVTQWLDRSQGVADCQPLFARVAAGKLDFSTAKKQHRVLQQLATERRSVLADAERARSINSRYRKYGRSLYAVEQTLKEAGCVQPNIALLRNAWPLEVYDALCSQDDYQLVSCEWGRCAIKR
ncbi:hypothetical protein [Reinekea sp.]|jgi:hypothetical protein|uniref:hypothetical protein n=1 Tax=Reinekea sp. TaxID=1970455 RepID=UPI002A83D40A|nr:hypothetical protein [Reinekea sp.]